MKANARAWLAAVAAGGLFLLAPMPTQAQGLSQQQLEQLAAPIALYPDPLIAQILDAAQYPQEVAAASRWRSTLGAALDPGQAAEALSDQPWAASVKALVDVPDVLYAMSSDLSWTQALGRAHAMQDTQLLAAIQDLRRRAEAAGKLRTGPQQVIEDDGQAIAIYPSSDAGFWVPSYDPNQVYGTWPWSDYPPYFLGGPGYWGPDIVFTTIVYPGPHWRHRHWRPGHRHWQEPGVTAGRVAAPPVVVAPVQPAAVAAPPAPRGWPAERHEWRPRELQRIPAALPPSPIVMPRPAPLVVFPPTVPRSPDPPAIRVSVPAGANYREFHGSDGARTFAAPPRPGAFGGEDHERGHGRR